MSRSSSSSSERRRMRRPTSGATSASAAPLCKPTTATMTMLSLAALLRTSSADAGATSANVASAATGTGLQRHLQYQHRYPRHDRSLALGDFDVLNELYAKTVIELPPTSFTTEVMGGDLVVGLSNIVCYNLNVGDVVVDWEDDDSAATAENNNDSDVAKLSAKVSVVDVDVDCNMTYSYEYLFFSGDGEANLQTENNDVQVDISIEVDGSTRPPGVAANVGNCQSQVNVASFELDGEGLGLISAAVNQFEDTIKETVANEMESALCQEFNELDGQLQSGLEGMVAKLYAAAADGAGGNGGAGSSDGDTASSEKFIAAAVPDSVRLLNFRNPATQMEDLVVGTLLEQASSLLGSDSTSNLIRDSGLVDPADGGFAIDGTQLGGLLGSVDAGGGNGDAEDGLLGSFSAEITSARLYGLDSFAFTSPVAPVGNYTLGTTFSLPELTLQLGVTLTVRASSSGATASAPPPEFSDDFVLEWTLSDIEGSLAVLLAIDSNAMLSVPLGAILTAASSSSQGGSDDLMSSALAGCLAAAVYDLQLAELKINSLKIQKPVIAFGLESSPGIKRLLTDAIDSVFVAFEPLLQEVLPTMMSDVARSAVEESLSDVDQLLGGPSSTALDAIDGGGAGASCQAPNASSPGAFVDFRDLLLSPQVAVEYGASGTEPYGGVASALKGWINSEFLAVDPETGIATGLSDQVAEMTQSQSGIPGMVILPSPVNTRGRIDIGGLQARYAVAISDVRIDNLQSLGSPIFFLEPVEQQAYMLNNSATFGLPPSPIVVNGTIMFELKSEEGEIRNVMKLGMELHSASLLVTLFMKMLESGLFNFPIGDIFNINCWLSTIPAPTLNLQGLRTPDSEITLSLADLAVSIAQTNFSVDCLDCSGPKFEELSALFDAPSAHVHAGQSFENVLNKLLSLVSSEHSMLQTELDRMLVDAPKFCPHRPEYDPYAVRTQYDNYDTIVPTDDDAIFLLALIVAMACFAVGVLVITCVLRFIVLRRNRRWLMSLPREQLIAVYENQQIHREHAAAMNAASQSMITSKRLPLLVRLLVPVVLLANVGLFLSGHLNLGGEVQIYFELGGERIVISDFYSFSIAQSGVELWNAGARELAMLMLIFSGVWPYTKQLITLVLWFLPPRLCSMERRGSIFLWLDALAKWSMIDVFVMIITVAAFHVTIQSPDKVFLPDTLYQVDLIVVPMWGLYANMLAQLLSQVTSHIIIHYHRVLLADAEKRIASDMRLQQQQGAAICVVPTCEEEEVSGGTDELVNDVDLEGEAPLAASSASAKEEGRVSPAEVSSSSASVVVPATASGDSETDDVDLERGASGDSKADEMANNVDPEGDASCDSSKTDEVVNDAHLEGGASRDSSAEEMANGGDLEGGASGDSKTDEVVNDVNLNGGASRDSNADEMANGVGLEGGANHQRMIDVDLKSEGPAAVVNKGNVSPAAVSSPSAPGNEDSSVASPAEVPPPSSPSSGVSAVSSPTKLCANKNEDSKEALNRHQFARPHRGESEKLRIRRFVNPCVYLLTLGIVALVLVGCTTPSFSYDYLGLLGVAMESGQDFKQAYYEHSVITIAQLFVDLARFLDTTKDYVGLTSIGVLLLLTTLFVPIALSLVLCCEWFFPLRRVVANRLRVVVEILQAWQYMEVFLLALIVGAWQIGDVSGFLVNAYCGGLEGTFTTLVHYGIIVPEDAQCFRVQAAIKPASYVMIAAAVTLHLLTSFVSKAAQQRARDEEDADHIEQLRRGRIQRPYRNHATSLRTRLSSEEDRTGGAATDEEDGEGIETTDPPVGKITPVPVLFTDQFRWLLQTAAE